MLAQDYRYELFDAPLCWPVGEGNCSLPLRNGALPLIIFAICFVCLIVTLIALSTVKPKNPVEVQEAKYVPAELMSYTLPYVVSFMSLDYQDTGKFTGLIIFLGWMFLITHRSGQVILNPLLAVLGWRLYEVSLTYAGNDTWYVVRALSKDDLQTTSQARALSIQDVTVLKAVRTEDEN